MSNDTTYISFSGWINPKTSNELMGAIGAEVEKGVTKIYLLLSTPGGSVDPGIAIYNMLRAMPVELTIHNVGRVDSVGNVVYLAGETRYACSASSFMFHGVAHDIEKARLAEKDLIEKLDNLKSLQGIMADIIGKRTDIDPEEAEGLFLRAAFMNPQEAQDRGIVHEIREAQVPQGARFLQLLFDG